MGLGVQSQAALCRAEKHWVYPEYQATRSVLLSDALLTNHRDLALLAAVLATGLEVRLLSVYPELESLARQTLRQQWHFRPEQLSQLHSVPVEARSAWVRDWAPIFAQPLEQPQALTLLDPEYIGPEHALEDAVPQQLYDKMRSEKPDLSASLDYKALPFYLEGGNLLCQERICFAGDSFLTANRAHDKDREAVLKAAKHYLSQRLYVIPSLPHEPTGHLDIWAKFLDSKTLVVSEILPESLAYAPSDLLAPIREMQAFLNLQATGMADGQAQPGTLAYLARRALPDLRILRLPMPLPWDDGGHLVVPNYANGLLLNQIALLPRYQAQLNHFGPPQPYPDAALMPEYEARAAAAYATAGYRVHWVSADRLIRDGGALHCAALQIPQRSPDD